MKCISSISLIIFSLILSSCFEESRGPASTIINEVSLYTGIPGVARLGESPRSVINNTDRPHMRSEISSESALGKIGFIELFHFKEIGTRLFFKRDGLGMIIIQEPFKGIVKGKKINLFAFSVPPVSNWESHLIKELGAPESRASGGRFGSEGLFYDWGDISYNRMGPNEMALYRNPDIAKYRLTSFGREIEFFPQK